MLWTYIYIEVLSPTRDDIHFTCSPPPIYTCSAIILCHLLILHYIITLSFVFYLEATSEGLSYLGWKQAMVEEMSA